MIGSAGGIFDDDVFCCAVPSEAIGGVPAGTLPALAEVTENKTASFDFDLIEKHAGGPAFDRAAVASGVGCGALEEYVRTG